MASNESLEWFWNKLNDHLESKGLKQTKQRKAIVEYFLEMENHLSAEELYDHIRKSGDHIGLATIYRTLTLLKEAGLVEQNQFIENKTVYETRHPDSHHDHLICMKCGKIIEFEDNEIEDLQKKVAINHNFKLVSHSLDLFGFCEACS
ncbi:MAG: transcriptional repressor [Zetaproteobacteria bacterium]|nr:transcriptional repressor [Pseudobdellovibrionaceae bacterium]|tara:strand:+ start:50 stop:493 length:444 start_codon:yes stop_codon:yes gene_type:complete